MSPRVLTDLQREKHRLVRCFSRHESLPHKELAAQPQFWQVHVASHSVTHLNEGSWGVLITKKAPKQVLLKEGYSPYGSERSDRFPAGQSLFEGKRSRRVCTRSISSGLDNPGTVFLKAPSPVYHCPCALQSPIRLLHSVSELSSAL